MKKQMFGILILFSSITGTTGWKPSTYPDYCSKDIATRNMIPPLSDDQRALVSELKQVHVMIRHGARTPYTDYSCWKDYSKLVSWNNCNITELMVASDSYTSTDISSLWLFRKIYDGSPNALGGNCLTGQLIQDGFDQQKENGRILAATYLNGFLPLFPSGRWEDLSEGEVYLRSDDEQRTLMSGQILVQNMFQVRKETIVPWHTGDYDLDQIRENSQACPRLQTLAEEATLSMDQGQREREGEERVSLSRQLNRVFGEGTWVWGYTLDCLMTTVCTGRDVPEGMTQSLFDSTISRAEREYAYIALFNDSQWSRLAMRTVTKQIRENLLSVIKERKDAKKFVLFSAHDTSVMPLLAAVLGDNWDKRWAPYASMVTLEFYKGSGEVNMVSFFFRLVYNGVPQIVPGCPDSLCDVSVLLETLSFGQNQMSCAVEDDVLAGSTVDSTEVAGVGVSESTWVILVILAGVIGILCGVVGMIFLDSSRRNDDILKDSVGAACGSFCGCFRRSHRGYFTPEEGITMTHSPINLNSPTSSF